MLLKLPKISDTFILHDLWLVLLRGIKEIVEFNLLIWNNWGTKHGDKNRVLLANSFALLFQWIELNRGRRQNAGDQSVALMLASFLSHYLEGSHYETKPESMIYNRINWSRVKYHAIY